MGNPGWDCWAFRRMALHSEGRAPATHGTSCLCKNKHIHGQMLVTQHLTPNSQFQSWKAWSWKQFQNFGVSGNFQQMHVLFPSTALKVHLLLQITYQRSVHQCSRESLGRAQHWAASITPALSVALPEDVLLHTAPGCTVPGAKWEQCWGRNSLDFLILSTWQGPTAAPAHSWCSLGAALRAERRRVVGTCPRYMVLKVAGKAKRKYYCTRSKKAKGQRH